MSMGWPGFITGILCSFGTLFFGLTVGKKKSYYTWTALFVTLAVAVGLQFMYQNFSQFHGQAFWILVATTGTAAAFLFLAANLTLVRPTWKWLHWLWPVMGLLGLLAGGTLASFPDSYTTTVIWTCYGLAALVLQKSNNKNIRHWMYAGLCIKLLSIFIFHVDAKTGWLGPLPIEHLLQLASHFCFWTGAKKA